MNNTKERKISSRRIWHGPIAWMVENSVAANLLMCAMLIGGLIFAQSMRQEIMPPSETDTVSISLSLSGASPEELEKSMVQVVEANIRDVENVDEITSVIRGTGFATVSVTMVEGADRDRFLQDIQNEVTRINSFPEGADTPIVSINKRTTEVMTIILYGSDDVLFLQEWAEIVKDELIAQPNITQVSIDNTFDREIQIEVSQNTLRKLGFTLDEIASIVRASSVEQGAGAVESAHGDIAIKFDGRKDYAQEFGQISVISASDGSRLLLSDIATIKENFSDSRSWANYNNSSALLITVASTGKQTPADVANEAKEVVESLNTRLPNGLKLKIQTNYAEDFIERIQLLSANATMGIILVFVCLALFLQPKLAMWVSLGIPASILGSFAFLNYMDISINMITLFAFILTLGIVVDDAIVVGENIHIWRNKGYTKAEAAVLGTKEIVVPVTFSVFTNIVAFLPIMYLPGQMGKTFQTVVPVVSIVFLCSLLESFFVLPSHLAHDKEAKKGTIAFRLNTLQNTFSKAFTKGVEKYYGALLTKIFEFRMVIVTVCFCLLSIASSYGFSGKMQIELFPSQQQDYAYFFLTMPSNTSSVQLRSIQTQVAEAAQHVIKENGGEKLSTGVYVSVRGNILLGLMYLTDEDTRPLSTLEVTQLWRKQTGEIRNAESITFMSDRGGAGSGKNLTIKLSNTDNDILQQAASALVEELGNLPMVSEAESGTSDQVKEYIIKMTPMGEQLGFTASTISQQIYEAFEGVTVLRQQRGRDEIVVKTSLPQHERADDTTLLNLVLRTPDGYEVYLRDTVTISTEYAPTSIRRTDGQRSLNVSSMVTPSSEATILYNELDATILPQIAALYPGTTWEKSGNLREIQQNMDALYQSLVFVLLAIYVLLAIPFKSYSQPLIIMVAIPFSIIGAIGGHYIMGQTLGVVSFMGVLALCGLVVNDSLVLIDFANKEMRKGSDARTAMHAAGIRRFRPILLTTLTTFIGLVPMLFEGSSQAQTLRPVAISLAFGIIFATIITLALVPSLYIILDDFIKKRKEKAPLEQEI